MEKINFWLDNKKPLIKPISKIPAIYQIINPNGKVYFGQTKDLHKRYYAYHSYSCEGQQKLYGSLAKYGIDAHEFYYLPMDIGLLDSYEEYLIAYYKTLDRKVGLNLVGGGLTRYIPQSVKNKISRSKRRSKPRFYKKSKSLTEDHKRHIGIGVLTSLTYQLGIASRDVSGTKNSFYGRKHSKESLAKISESKKGTLAYGKNPSAKPVWNTKTGEVFGCGKEVSELLGVKEGTFTSWLCGQRPNKTDFQYL